MLNYRRSRKGFKPLISSATMDERHKYWVIFKLTIVIILVVGALAGAREIFTSDSAEETPVPAVVLEEPAPVPEPIIEEIIEEPEPIEEQITAEVVEETDFYEEQERSSGGGGGSSSSSNNDPEPYSEPDPTYDVGREITLISGSTYEVVINIDVQDHDYIIVDETLPTGATVVDEGTGNTQTSGHIKWVIVDESIPSSLTYQVQISGDDIFSGIYATDLIEPRDIEGDLSI